MTNSKSRPKKIYPWTTVSAKDIRAKIDAALAEKTDLRSSSGKVLVPRRYVSIGNVLVKVFDSKKRQREAKEILDLECVEDILLPFLSEDPKWAVHCSVTDSMASGIWGLKGFAIGNRGYLYHEPDEGPIDRPILAAWEPTKDEQALRACFLDTYVREWDEIGLPPCMGQWAKGPFELMLDAVCSVLRRDTSAWSPVVKRLQTDYGRIEDGGGLFDELAEETVKLVGMPTLDVVEILRAFCNGSAPGKESQITDQERRILVAAFLIDISRGGFPI